MCDGQLFRSWTRIKQAGGTPIFLLTIFLSSCSKENSHPSANAERPPTQTVNAVLQKKYVTANKFEDQIEKTGGRIQLVLDLSYTKLTDEDLAEIEFPLHLTELDLTGCPITDEGLVHLAACRNLQQLNLSHTLVTGDCLATLERMPKLNAVHFHGTAITPDVQRKMIRVFRQRVPQEKKEKKRGRK